MLYGMVGKGSYVYDVEGHSRQNCVTGDFVFFLLRSSHEMLLNAIKSIRMTHGERAFCAGCIFIETNTFSIYVCSLCI